MFRVKTHCCSYTERGYRSVSGHFVDVLARDAEQSRDLSRSERRIRESLMYERFLRLCQRVGSDQFMSRASQISHALRSSSMKLFYDELENSRKNTCPQGQFDRNFIRA